ncbi:hypothetical protein ATG_12130 [Desulfurococcaceae archaeon AG1]|jgi:ABC-type glucose/galactose transport system permease subunit|nr:hypothetical protein ATG_12130 [Desulfurococcaceae archaeon AG1]
MTLSRIRLYVLGLVLTALIMSAVFGAIFIFIHEINIALVIAAVAAILVVWGVNTYYLLRIIDEEERVGARAGED